jgi:hypothetical protein
MWGSFSSAINSVVDFVQPVCIDLATKTAALIEGEKAPEVPNTAVAPWLHPDVPLERRADVEARVRELSG